MRSTENWKDYELIDASEGERLERWGDIILIRPDPQAIWKTPRLDPRWKQAHGRYHRSKSGGGKWEFYKKIPEVWSINYGSLKFNLKPMGFKHTGIFPEQAVNWDFCAELIKKSQKPLKILNLFGYTGAATLSALAAGASVTHVDASKGMVAWGKENAQISRLSDRPVRWLVDDCIKFVNREIRRGNIYDGIILDPPSYGRGPGGEVWQLEEKLYDFLLSCKNNKIHLTRIYLIFIMQNSGNIHPNPLILRIFFPDFFLIQSPKRIHYIISAKFPGNRKRKIV